MRWIVRIVAGILMLIVVLLGLVWLMPAEKVVGIAAERFEAETGRKLTIEGPVRPKLWPELGVETGPVRIANADWSDQGPLLTAEAMRVGVNMAALWGGAVKVTQVEVTGPRIMLERARDGRVNWEFGRAGGAAGGDAAAPPAGKAMPVTLDQAVIRDGELHFIDGQSGQQFALQSIDAELRLPDPDGEASLQLSARKGNVPLLVDLGVSPFQRFASGGLGDIELSAGLGDTSIRFQGRAGLDPVAAEGEVTADLADLASLMALMGKSGVPELPPGLGQNQRKLSGTVTLAPEGSFHLRGGTILLDDNRLEGDADLRFGGDRPDLQARLRADALDLSGLSDAGSDGGAEKAGGDQQAQAGWSATPVDASALAALNGVVSIAANSYDLGGLRLGKGRVVATLDRSRLVVETSDLEAYGGRISGNLVANNRSGLSTGGKLALRGIAMQPLLIDMTGQDRLIGAADVDLQFLALGQSLRAMMMSLSGSGRIALGKGEWLGLDLAGMLRTLDPSYRGEGQKTIFDGVSASFTMADGVLHNDDLVLESPFLAARGQGRIGIGMRDLDYRITAATLQGIAGEQGLELPVLITGPWADPKIRLDLDALTDQKLEAEKARLKAKGRVEEERAKEKLKEELGIEQAEGESLEDAAKRRARDAVEKEAGRALRRLLGGN